MSALNLSWLPEDPDTREQEAEDAWPMVKAGVPLVQWPPPSVDPFEPEPELDEYAGTGSRDDNWPPIEADVNSDDGYSTFEPEPLPARTSAESEPGPTQSGPMQALQKVVDESSDHDVRWMRARGCDLMPKRWGGVEPS